MKIADKVKCPGFPCKDIDKNGFIVPPVDIDPADIKALVITEAPSPDKADYFYSAGNPFYLQTTLQTFREAGEAVNSIKDILSLGIRYKMS
jgi:uracil-DNA glycosylase